MKLLSFFSTLCLTALVTFQLAAAPIMIDDFSEPAATVFSETAPVGTFPIVIADTGLATTNVIGGSRDVTIDFVAAPGPGDNINGSYGSAFGNQFSMFTGGVNASTLDLFSDANVAGLSADLSSQAGIALDFDIFDAAAIGTVFTLNIDDGSGISSSMQTALLAGPQTFDFLFSDFAGLDTSTIDSIHLTASVPANGDIRLLNIQTIENVPEPASVAIWALLGICISVGTWKLRRK